MHLIIRQEALLMKNLALWNANASNWIPLIVPLLHGRKGRED